MPPAKSSCILPSQRIEPYNDIEVRIEPAITFIQSSSDNYPNLTAIAQRYEIPVFRLRGRLHGRQSCHERPGTNLKLTEGQELAGCLYLDCHDSIGTSGRQKMVAGWANAILQYAHIGEGAVPVVGSHWAPRFPPATQSIIFANNVQSISIERTHMNQKAFVLGLRNIVLFVRITILSPATSTILTKLRFVLALAEISGSLLVILPDRLILEVLQIGKLLVSVRPLVVMGWHYHP